MQDSQPSTSGRQGQHTVWAAVINFERQGRADAGEAEAAPGAKRAARYIVDVLANCTEDSLPGRGPKRQLLSSLIPTGFTRAVRYSMCFYYCIDCEVLHLEFTSHTTGAPSSS